MRKSMDPDGRPHLLAVCQDIGIAVRVLALRGKDTRRADCTAIVQQQVDKSVFLLCHMPVGAKTWYMRRSQALSAQS